MKFIPWLICLTTLTTTSIWANDTVLSHDEICNREYNLKIFEQYPDDTVKYEIKPKLIYPENMQEFGNRGYVALEASVNNLGEVNAVKTRYSVHPDLERAAVQAMLQAKLIPLASKQSFCVRQLMSFDMQAPAGAILTQNAVDPFKIPPASKDLPNQLQYDEAPRIRLAMPVVYPLHLLKEKKTGKAKVSILIDPEGKVHESKVLSASDPAFGLAAQASFHSWQFYPAKKDKQASWSVLVKEQTFNLYSRDTKLSDSAKQILSKLKSGSEQFYTFEQLDQMPKIRYQPLPKKLDDVKQAKVVVEFYVDKDGLVQLPSIISTDHDEQAWLVLTAIKRWQFEVPKHQGKAVITKFVLPFEFN